jgi:hypothetical protein
MKHFWIKPAGAFLVALAALAGNAQAKLASPGETAAPAASKKAGTKAGQPSHVKFLSGSEESAKERSSRLRRECKGRVNAGACAGYTY